MHFPKHWARGHWEGPDRNGRTVSRVAWGWSDSSVDDARAKGAKAARKKAESFDPEHPPTNRYGYPDRPLREPVLSEISDACGHVAVTRNSYGCEVLNTDRIVFVDVDLPEVPEKSGGLLGSLFGGKRKRDEARADLEAQRISLLDAWQQNNARTTFRVYRTAAGLRYLMTSGTIAADQALVDDLFSSVGADPAYRALCKRQMSFRARLTPKPWRMGFDRPPHRFPFENAGEVDAMEKWHAGYAGASEEYATCFFLLKLGPGNGSAELAPHIARHDAATKSGSGLPLA